VMEALEIETNPDRPVLPLGPDAQDEGHNVTGAWGDGACASRI
jgi:hypothetical protein